jgi:hypothetical protein
MRPLRARHAGGGPVSGARTKTTPRRSCSSARAPPSESSERMITDCQSQFDSVRVYYGAQED